MRRTGTTGAVVYLDAYSEEGFFRGENLPFAGWPAAGFIEQEATYWRRSLWERSGGRLDETLKLAADFELWARFHQSGARLYSVPIPLAGFRNHGNQKSHVEFLPTSKRHELSCVATVASRRAAKVFLLRRVLLRVLPQRLLRKAAKLMETSSGYLILDDEGPSSTVAQEWDGASKVTSEATPPSQDTAKSLPQTNIGSER